MGKMSRDKGARWERSCVKLFAGALVGAVVKRGLQSRHGAEVSDVECPCFWIECKVGKLPNPRAALRQAVEALKKSGLQGKWPIAVIKDDRGIPFIAMQLDDFLDLVAEWWERGKQ